MGGVAEGNNPSTSFTINVVSEYDGLPFPSLPVSLLTHYLLLHCLPLLPIIPIIYFFTVSLSFPSYPLLYPSLSLPPSLLTHYFILHCRSHHPSLPIILSITVSYPPSSHSYPLSCPSFPLPLMPLPLPSYSSELIYTLLLPLTQSPLTLYSLIIICVICSTFSMAFLSCVLCPCPSFLCHIISYNLKAAFRPISIPVHKTYRYY